MVTSLPTPANSNQPEPEDTGADSMPMSAVLARAEAAVADLAKEYGAWALADVKKARKALTAATDDPAQRAYHVEAVFRVAHNLKGQGASFGFPLVTKIGQSLCALTRDRALHYETEHLDLATSHLDAIELVLTKSIKGEGGKVGPELVAKLEQRVAEILG
ncbi:MAG TPA: Hpt domain-containing protein [Dongiaceae bacterium]|jgi:chemotaxis protein histidine kinase CheA|nr:Hpt domain-containing protein [Dongiaceae bacterium]